MLPSYRSPGRLTWAVYPQIPHLEDESTHVGMVGLAIVILYSMSAIPDDLRKPTQLDAVLFIHQDRAESIGIGNNVGVDADATYRSCCVSALFLPYSFNPKLSHSIDLAQQSDLLLHQPFWTQHNEQTL